jgi:hypothetical protein
VPYTYAKLDLVDLDVMHTLSHIEFANKLHTVANCFATHEGFQGEWPPPVPKPAELTAAADHHIAISNEADTGNRFLKAERDAHRPLAFQLVAMMVQWAVIRSIRENNPGLLKNLGLELKVRNSTRSSSHPPLVAPSKLKVVQGPTTTVTVRTEKVPGTATYHVEICTGDPTVAANWVEASKSPYCTQVVQGLEPGKVYHFRVWCFGASGQGPCSAIVTLMVT